MPRKQKLLQKKLQQMSTWHVDELAQHAEMNLLMIQEHNSLSAHSKHCLREVAHVVHALLARSAERSYIRRDQSANLD